MQNEKWILNVDDENQQMEIRSNLDKILAIDCAKDIELTDLVSILAKHIDTGKEIEVEVENSENMNERMTLVVETVSGIIVKYNESIMQNEEEEDTENSIEINTISETS